MRKSKLRHEAVRLIVAIVGRAREDAEYFVALVQRGVAAKTRGDELKSRVNNSSVEVLVAGIEKIAHLWD